MKTAATSIIPQSRNQVKLCGTTGGNDAKQRKWKRSWVLTTCTFVIM